MIKNIKFQLPKFGSKKSGKTRILENTKKAMKNRPAAVAEALKSKALYIALFFGAISVASIIMIVFGVWTPGLAWLE